jgi:hypothetical protein
MTTSVSKLLDKIIDKKCWYAAAGGSTGSMFNLHLGDKLPRERSLPSESAIKNLQGEARVFVQDAHWELYQEDQLIAFDESDSSPDGDLVKSLNRLVGKRLTRYEETGQLVDLIFDGGLLLKIGLRKSNPKESSPRLTLVYGEERLNID